MPTVLLISSSLSETDYLRQAVEEAVAEAGDVSSQPFEFLTSDPRLIAPTRRDGNIQHLDTVDILVMDVTGGDEFTIWALGYSHAKGKPVILITSNLRDIPADLRHEQWVIYDEGRRHSRSFLRVRITEAILALSVAISASGAAQSIAPMQHIVRPDRMMQHIFVSYSHQDSAFLERIRIHLRPLEREGRIDLWSDTRIQPGAVWREEIRTALDSARVAILVISADFLGSDFVNAVELPALLRAAEERGTRIIPLIVKPSRFLREESLSRFQALNDPARPLIDMDEAERERVYARLAEIVELDLCA